MVIDEATDRAFDRYRDMLSNKGVRAYNSAAEDFSKLLKNVQLSHCLWMCDECTKLENKHWSIDKKSRWLGFVQAVIIMHGLTTINAERNITRPWFTGVDTPTKA